MMAKLFRVILPVSDIEEAAVFYSKVLEAPGERVSAGRHYFDCEGVILACYDAAADGDLAPVRPLPEPLYLAVDDLEKVFSTWKKEGGSLPEAVVPDAGPLGEIAERPWGERSFYAIDPYGNSLCFVSTDTVFTGGRGEQNEENGR